MVDGDVGSEIVESGHETMGFHLLLGGAAANRDIGNITLNRVGERRMDDRFFRTGLTAEVENVSPSKIELRSGDDRYVVDRDGGFKLYYDQGSELTSLPVLESISGHHSVSFSTDEGSEVTDIDSEGIETGIVDSEYTEDIYINVLISGFVIEARSDGYVLETKDSHVFEMSESRPPLGETKLHHTPPDGNERSIDGMDGMIGGWLLYPE